LFSSTRKFGAQGANASVAPVNRTGTRASSLVISDGSPSRQQPGRLRSSQVTSAPASNHLPQNMRQHFAPPGPIVIHILAPEIQSVRNALAVQDVCQLTAPTRIFVGSLPRSDVDRICFAQDR